MSNVIPMITTRPARARGVFAAINVAARSAGLSDQAALRAAQRARSAYEAGGTSAGRVVADACARFRQRDGSAA